MHDVIIKQSIYLLFFLTIGLVNCSKANYTNTPIIEDGIYKFENGYTLKIEIKNTFVKYYLLDQLDNVLLQPELNISTFQKWMAIWDGEYFWFASSDIGDVVWAKNQTGNYQKIWFTELGSLESKLPKEMQENYYKYKEKALSNKKILLT